MDNYTYKSLAIEVGQHLGGQRVVEILTLVVLERGKPEKIKVDNSLELTSTRLDQ